MQNVKIRPRPGFCILHGAFCVLESAPAALDTEMRRDTLAAMTLSLALFVRMWGRLSSLPVHGAFQPHQSILATGKSPEPAGWKACPTYSGAVSLGFALVLCLGAGTGVSATQEPLILPTEVVTNAEPVARPFDLVILGNEQIKWPLIGTADRKSVV